MIRIIFCTVFTLLNMLALQAYGAVSLDRTRVIYPGDAKSMSLHIKNNNNSLPYLAQGWLEDDKGNKIKGPFVVLPPIQRLEPGMDSLIKIQALPAVSSLPKDRESLFYFNLREIPPRSDKPNTIQLALQTRIKFFYRPENLRIRPGVKETWQEKIILKQAGSDYQLTNDTPYYVTIVSASRTVKGESIDGFKPVMISPYSTTTLSSKKSELGSQPTFTYVDDYGGRRTLSYQCATSCTLRLPIDN